VFTVISKNAMSRKVLARKVLGFKCVQVTPLTFLGTHLVAPWKMLFTPFRYWFVIFLGLLKGASIKLLDVNEVAIIMIILREPQHPNFE
jgi:hypothetical protein